MNKRVTATLREGLRSSNRLEQYAADVKAYQKFADETYKTTEGRLDLRRASVEEIKQSSQQFIDYMKAKGQSPYTIAHRMTGLATALGTTKDKLPCETIYRGQPQKGRDNARVVRNELNARVREFNSLVGIRREEIGSLKGDNLKEKEGRLYVVVEKGKGGKYQEQLILKKDEAAVRAFFDGKGKNEYIFSKNEMKACEHANLHGLRREHAQECYKHYETLLKDPAERERMKDLLEQRFNENREKMGRFDRDKMDIPYVTRGAVRTELYNAGRPLVYDRLAVMATSVLHLAHYREDVCVKNYMK